MNLLNQEAAQLLFNRLPHEKQIATLSPAFVAMDAKRDTELSPYYLAHTEGEYFWLHSVLKGSVPNSDFIDFQSAYGYGGPVSNTEDVTFLNEAWFKYCDWCIDHGVLAEFVRLHPMLNHPFYGELQQNRQTVFLPPDSVATPTCRNKIRKGEGEGLSVVTTPARDIVRFAYDYRKSMERLNADKFYYFNDEYFEALARMPNANLIICELDKECLAAAIFMEGGPFFEYHLSFCNERGRKKAATNILLDRAQVFAGNYGKGIYLGGGKTTLNTDPLLEFKRSFGGKFKPFFTCSKIHREDVYYSMQEEYIEIGPINPRTLFWR